MNNIQVKLGATLSYVSIALKILISLIYTPVMLRLLGQQEYGLYQLSASVVSNLSILSLGFSSSYVRFFARSQGDEPKVELSRLNGMYMLINSVLALVVLVVGMVLVSQSRLVFGPTFSHEELVRASQLLFILVINLSLSFVNMTFNAYIIANQNFIFQRILEIVQALTSPFLQLPLLLLGFGSLGVVIGTTLTSIIIYLVNIIYSFKKLSMKVSFRGMDFELFREIGSYSSFIFIAMIIDQINWSVDVYLVGRFKGTLATASYAIAEQIDGYFRTFATALTNVLIPSVHLLIANKTSNEHLSHFFAKTGRVQFVIMALFGTGFIFFGRPFIHYWAGENYNNSYAIAVVMVIPLIFITSQSLGIEIRRAKNQQKFYTLVSFITATLNVILTAIFLNFFSPISAAFSTSITLVLNAIILNWDYSRNLGIDMKYFWSEIVQLFKAMIIPIAVGVVIVSFVNLYDIKLFVLGATMYVVTYVVSVWFLGLSREEKDMVLKRK
ncbi:oligosaccharide flippase family protein [Aerococcus urinaeequi]|uniref:oligosaccharide flippase family protein n=1 Tax=Aerococcus urinaeequi TaxID=51665 RepID=UPI0028908152|nr:oligosaccharide flippase family protein [Aerococcus urinaeequi]MDT2761835.1 oligosaccharide flippase family protein [Aerococcus urinaeequi]